MVDPLLLVAQNRRWHFYRQLLHCRRKMATGTKGLEKHAGDG
jgi:hypothetical protein